MTKGIKSLNFSFVPFPSEVWDNDVPLSLAEFRFLGYLCKQIRFGEALRPISDDEMMHGVFESGKRKDRGCGLTSRNGVKQAREALVERGWITAENTSQDPSRPRWMYDLVLAKDQRSSPVSERQLVSQRDTGTERHDVSAGDTGTVTARQEVAQGDRCNKEEETPKKDYKLKKAARRSRLSQSERASWDLRRWQAVMKESEPQAGEHIDDPDEHWRARARRAAFAAGLVPQRIVELLKAHFPNDKNIDLLYYDQKIQPALFQGKPA